MKRYRFRYYSKNRKMFFRFTCILASALLAILFSLFMQMHNFETKKEQNESLYGSWQGAVYDISQATLVELKNNEMVDAMGHMYILGDVRNKDLFAGSIGYVDPAFMGMANLELQNGHFPEKKNEIAIEKMKLDQMGLDYSLGQTIQIEIIQDEQIIEKEYILSGIINNYSSTWLSEGRLVSFFVMKDPSIEPIEHELFFTVMEGYLESLEDIHSTMISRLILNRNVEFYYDPFSSQNLPFTLLFMFSIAYSILILLYIVRQWTQSHGRELVMLKSMGASTAMFVRDLFELLLRSLVLSFGLFVLASLLLSIPLSLLCISLGIYFVSLGIVLIGCMLWINNVPSNINSFAQDTTIIHKRISVKYKKVTPLKMVLRSFRFHLKQELLQMAICILLLVFSYVALTQTIQNYRSFELVERQEDVGVRYPTETYYTTSYYDEEGKDHGGTTYMIPEIEASVANQFITHNAIQDYRTYMWDNRYYVEWEGMEDSPVFRHEKDIPNYMEIYEGWDRKNHLFPIVYSQDDLEYYEFLKTHIDEGQWNEEAFVNGEIIYIYLPEYTNEVYMDDQELDRYAEDSDPDTFYDQQHVYQDDTLHVGDTITFYAKDQAEKKIKVGGIIRNYYSSELELIPNNNYQIFVSKGFYGGIQPINQIALYFDTNGNNEMLESYFSTVASRNGMEFVNQSQEKRRRREIVRDDLLLYGVIFIGILLVLVFTQVLFVSNKQRVTRYQHMVFLQLGISNTVFNKMRYADLFLKVPIILIFSFGLFVLVQYLEYLPEKRLMNSFRVRFNDDHWSWIIFIIINVVFILMYDVCSMQVYKRRSTHGSNHNAL